ncbi:arylsulfatase B-like [Lineus longissimus]|uniref:arylsulfatase B-like n=1 Tax=Lineus longissimus TaxID=88925 RepID=UPI00315C7464
MANFEPMSDNAFLALPRNDSRACPEEEGWQAWSRLALAEIYGRVRQKMRSICHRRRWVNIIVSISIVVFFFTVGGAIRHGGRTVYSMQTKRAVSSTLFAHARRFLLGNDPPGPMNVIFIVADDLGWSDVGFRNKYLLTPNLDRLAREGVILNQSYVASTCSPSRAAFLTGYYPHKMGLQHRTIGMKQAKFIPLSIPTLAEELKSRGYVTRAVGKWHLGNCNWKYTPTKRGFDSHFGYLLSSGNYYTHLCSGVHDYWNDTTPDYNHENVYSTDTFADIAVDLIRGHSATRADPLFIYLAFTSIHGPLNPPPTRYMSTLIKDQPGFDRRATVSRMLLALDMAVGRVVNALETSGMMKNTLLVFTSDNGGAVQTWGNNAPLRGGKFTQWEGGTRAVTFINSPMVKYPGREFNGLFHAVDWVPTILGAVDSQMNSQPTARFTMDGLNQWDGLVENRNGTTRKDIVYVFDEIDGTYVYRYGRFKLMVGPPVCGIYQEQWTRDHSSDPNCWFGNSYPHRRNHRCDYQLADTMLFDVVKDPEERYDLATLKPDIVDDLKRRMQDLRKDAVPHQSELSNDITGHIIDGVLYPGWC